jgi:hypothetical protein
MHNDQLQKEFKPKGAIAFFVLLLILCAGLWFSLYYVMLQKQ